MQRLYFYYLSPLGHLYHLSEEKAICCFINVKEKQIASRAASLPTGPAHLKMIPFLNFFFRQLRPSKPNLAEMSENQQKLQKYFPYQSACKGEMNFLHAAETPFVFHSLDKDLEIHSTGQQERKLLYAGNLKSPFQPNLLRVDSENGQIYYPSPSPHFNDPCLVSSPLAIQLSNYFIEKGQSSEDYSGISICLDSNGNLTNSENASPLLYLPKETQMRLQKNKGEYY